MVKITEEHIEEYIENIVYWFSLPKLEIFIPKLKKRIDSMLEKIIDVIEMYETDDELKNFKGAIKALYRDKKRIENFLLWKTD